MALNEKDYSPLNLNCAKALSDKLYGKRKEAALEIERMVRELVNNNDSAQIQRLITVLLNEFTSAQNPNAKKGGLLGLAAMAIALAKDVHVYLIEFVDAILLCCIDTDSQVRYYACESLYNVAKVARQHTLPFFNRIFDSLYKLISDPDQGIRNGTEVLDRLMMDIVSESRAFDMVAFLPLLRECIYAENQFCRQFIVSWISLLNNIPNINMLIYLPDILDGLFLILADNRAEIRRNCERLLGELLLSAKNHPEDVNFAAMVNILISHSQVADYLLQYTAIMWMIEFVNLSGRTMLLYLSGVLTSILPCVAYEDEARKILVTSIREVACILNDRLKDLITSDDDLTPTAAEQKRSNRSQGTRPLLTNLLFTMPNDTQVKLIPQTEEEKDVKQTMDVDTDVTIELILSPVVEVLNMFMSHECKETRTAVLKWVQQFNIRTPNKLSVHLEELFPVLLRSLKDPYEEVVMLDLDVLSAITSSETLSKSETATSERSQQQISDDILLVRRSQYYFNKLMVNVLQLFSTDTQLTEDRCSFIIRHLCTSLHSTDVYTAFSKILKEHPDSMFCCKMAKTLNTILLTSTELFQLRNELRLLPNKESCDLFLNLYNSWCHNAAATLSLCLLTQNYKHATDIISAVAELEVTVDFLTEMDKLVQLIESPIFTFLRLQLLDVGQNQYLVKTLYGILMILPQSNTFTALRNRLRCIPDPNHLPEPNKPQQSVRGTRTVSAGRKHLHSTVEFPELLEKFKKVQNTQWQSRHAAKSNVVL